ncbi:hypothetical protein BGX31_004392, partial [Mortierella sp. GBA43]
MVESMPDIKKPHHELRESKLPVWFYRSRVDEDNILTGVFWMSPHQVTLYRRYHDIVVHDTTAGTNRFGMSLHCFVVVDASFKSRLVASALTSSERIEDYNW